MSCVVSLSPAQYGWTHRRLLLPDTVKTAGQKQAVARPQLGDGDALASGPAESPVELRVGVSH